jgi:transposase
MNTHPPDHEVDDTRSGSTTSRRTTRTANRIEIIAHDARRDWPPEVKRQIVMESFTGELKPSELSRKHAISSGQLYTWRREFLAAYAAQAANPGVQFARVELAAPLQPVMASPPASEPAPLPQKGSIEIVMPGGEIVRIGANVDGRALRMVFSALATR